MLIDSVPLLTHPNIAYALLAAGVYALIYELAAPGPGVGGVVGGVCLVLGFSLLQTRPVNPLHLTMIGSFIAATALVLWVALRKALRANRSRPLVGPESLVGTSGEAQSELNPTGDVFLNGELWAAEGDSRIERGTKVVVTRIEGNKIFVKKA